MHSNQIEFCRLVKKLVPQFFLNQFVVDLGFSTSRQNHQSLFEGCLYLSVDFFPIEGIELNGQEFMLPDASVDVIIASIERIEHDFCREKTLKNITRILKPNGLLIFTATPSDFSCKNLKETDIFQILDVDKIFNQYQFCVDNKNQSLGFFGIKSNHFLSSQSYSIDIEYPSIELKNQLKISQFNLTSSQQRLTRLEQDLLAIKNSSSWRLTKPLRFSKKLITSILVKIKILSRQSFRKLPISGSEKQKLKNFVFSYFGVFFKKTEIYQTWFKLHKLTFNNQLTKMPNKVFPACADGHWEWSDYTQLKEYISKIKREAHQDPAVVAVNMISIAEKSIFQVAEQVVFKQEKNPTVSIIIPVFNNAKLTLECLLTILKHTDEHISYEVIVADDASTDETRELLQKVKNIKVICNEKNLGFLRNVNKALNAVFGDYVVLLNNDTQVQKNWLSPLFETFQKKEKVGAVGPRFLYPSGHLQEAGCSFYEDGTVEMLGHGQSPDQARFLYTRKVDYVSAACLMIPTQLIKTLGGFSEEFLPCYCEDSDLCLRIQAEDNFIYCNPSSTVVHHLSKTVNVLNDSFKKEAINKNLVYFRKKWGEQLDVLTTPRVIAFYLPQYHAIPENNEWWGEDFTEWTNVAKAEPNFVGHYQPRVPDDLGYYRLDTLDVMAQQIELALNYGVDGFCFYYYWFNGKRLLERPIEQYLNSKELDFPFCLCWANENWTRRWDGRSSEILMKQEYSDEDDLAVIHDLMRFFRDSRYIKIDGKPLILVYRITLFPDFAKTAQRWREACHANGIGEIYISLVEAMDLANKNKHPQEFGCDAAVEFPPHEMAITKPLSSQLLNSKFVGSVADYRDIVATFAARDLPAYTRFTCAMPGWDNTARRQDHSFCFENSSPAAFQVWLEEIFSAAIHQYHDQEQLVFINAWNEWAEGAYLEPDKKYGHSFLQAVKNARNHVKNTTSKIG